MIKKRNISATPVDLNFYDVSLLEKHLKDDNSVMPEFSCSYKPEKDIIVKFTFATPMHKNVHFIERNRLNKARWLIYRNHSHIERLLKNEVAQSRCRLCKNSIAFAIYNYSMKLLESKKFRSKDQEKCLIEMISIIGGSFQTTNELSYSSTGLIKPKPFNDTVSRYLKFYEQMYEGYCSNLCREIDFNWKTKNSYL